MDVNEQAESDWIDETRPIERIWSVIKRSDAQSVEEIAERSRTSPDDTSEILGQLATIDIVDHDSGEYRVPQYLQIALRASRLLDEADSNIEQKVEEMESEDDLDESTRYHHSLAEVATALNHAYEVEQNLRE